MRCFFVALLINFHHFIGKINAFIVDFCFNKAFYICKIPRMSISGNTIFGKTVLPEQIEKFVLSLIATFIGVFWMQKRRFGNNTILGHFSPQDKVSNHQGECPTLHSELHNKSFLKVADPYPLHF